ncbi:dihydrodipicolinate synthase [Thiovulum sp. ES]|nr:dihydrodipicolinate synthase [Thiovulum sp. ES]
MIRPRGSMTALITPFSGGKVDEKTYGDLIERQMRLGTDWVVPVGTTGESATLSHDEHQRCIEIAIEVTKNSETKVLAGAGSNSTIEAMNLAKFAEKAGADAILSVSPYYNKPTAEGLFLHYKAIADSVKIPVMLYNVPGRTGSDISPEVVKKLHERVENIFSIKEASGSLHRVVELRNIPNLDIISGDDAINYQILASGGNGVISVTANLLPNKMAELVKAVQNGDFQKGRDINQELSEINSVLFVESNPIPIKAIMHLAGLLPTLEYRLPLTPPSLENMKKLEKTLQKYEVLK